MNATMLRSSIHRLVPALLVPLTAAYAIEVKIVDDAVVQKALQATVVLNSYTGPEAGHATLGYFASADGLIVTMAATVEGAQKVSVRLADGSTISDAKFMGMDEKKRVAVLATNRSPTAFLDLCDSAPSVGDACAVIGMHPAERSFQATSGQLLARHLTLNQSETQLVDMWSVGARRDCFLNGGAVVNSSGKVVGVCDTISTRQKQWITRVIPDSDIQAALLKARQTTQPVPFPQLGEINPAMASPAQSDTDYLAGMQCLKQADYPAAIQRFTNVLDRYPKDPQTLTFLASCYSQTRQAEEVARCADELIKRSAKHWSARIGIAGMLSNTGSHAAASEHLQAVLKEEPRLGNAWTLHAAVLKRLGRKQEVREAARQGAELEPESLWSWTTLSDILLDLGDLTAYREAQDRADDLESLLFKLDHLPLRGLKVN